MALSLFTCLYYSNEEAVFGSVVNGGPYYFTGLPVGARPNR